MKIKKKVSKLVTTISDKITSNNGLSQELTKAEGERYMTEGIGEVIRQAGAEGVVLLKNDNVLPFTDKDKVSVFGRCQYNYFTVGYGSGGDVHPAYKVNLLSALRDSTVKINEQLASYYETWCNIEDNVPDDGFWGHWPMCYSEMPLTREMVTYSSVVSNCALVVIGRAAGEDRENKLKKGSYYLTDIEKKNLDLICDAFERVVIVMDCGNIIDMAWTEEYGDKIKAVLWAWQGGQESGNAVADVLSGRVCPSGKLCDTIAKTYEDYPSSHNFGAKDFNAYTEDIFVGYRYFETFAPEKVLYPFGFGLSYTDFEIKTTKFSASDGTVHIEASVTNTGAVCGKEVVQIYVSAPNGKLGNAKKSLVAFGKTKTLEPGETETLSFDIDEYEFSSYDDMGVTGNKSCYVLEKGEYRFLIGNSVKTEDLAGAYEAEECKVISQLREVCSVQEPFYRMTAKAENGKIVCVGTRVEKGERNLRERILSELPEEIGFRGDRGYKLQDVKDGKIPLDSFISQINIETLEGLTRGEGAMDSKLGIAGNAGAFGGTTEVLREKYGVPPVITSDGPAGIRIRSWCALLPCGSALASTWNTPLIEKLLSFVALELDHYHIDVLLSPGMNIHRNPLCGRNFEYFAEDPVLSGECAAAAIKGIQSTGVSACPKHFACNNQEYNRNYNDSRVSERALREIYLKGFEIAVKKAKPENIMTSYNKINGVWSHYNYDLVQSVLRGEWGYEGNVVTDWWMRKSASPEFPLVRDNAYRVRAGVEVLMPGNMSRVGTEYQSDGTLLMSVGLEGGLTRAEIERTAKHVLNFVLKRMN
ncbi:MAG: glycoside hydrolase family 3 protein [Acutalibacteraceae bacterium]